MMKKTKVFKCPDCRTRYTSEIALIKHAETIHKESIPDDVTTRQYLFNRRNKKTFSLCIICRKNKTAWNEQKGRYEKFCSDQCRIKAGIIAENNLKRVTGKGRKERLQDPTIQKEMMNNRSISGIYRFESGVTIPYVGSYEQDFLRFYEKEFKGSPRDIIQCPYTFKYTLPDEVRKKYNIENTEFTYIPDFFIPSLHLIIEVKDGGDNPNKHQHMELDRIKEYFKDQAVIKNKSFNYCKVYNKTYTGFMNTVNRIREQGIEMDSTQQIIWM